MSDSLLEGRNKRNSNDNDDTYDEEEELTATQNKRAKVEEPLPAAEIAEDNKPLQDTNSTAQLNATSFCVAFPQIPLFVCSECKLTQPATRLLPTDAGNFRVCCIGCCVAALQRLCKLLSLEVTSDSSVRRAEVASKLSAAHNMNIHMFHAFAGIKVQCKWCPFKMTLSDLPAHITSAHGITCGPEVDQGRLALDTCLLSGTVPAVRPCSPPSVPSSMFSSDQLILYKLLNERCPKPGIVRLFAEHCAGTFTVLQTLAEDNRGNSVYPGKLLIVTGDRIVSTRLNGPSLRNELRQNGGKRGQTLAITDMFEILQQRPRGTTGDSEAVFTAGMQVLSAALQTTSKKTRTVLLYRCNEWPEGHLSMLLLMLMQLTKTDSVATSSETPYGGKIRLVLLGTLYGTLSRFLPIDCWPGWHLRASECVTLRNLWKTGTLAKDNTRQTLAAGKAATVSLGPEKERTQQVNCAAGAPPRTSCGCKQSIITGDGVQNTEPLAIFGTTPKGQKITKCRLYRTTCALASRQPAGVVGVVTATVVNDRGFVIGAVLSSIDRHPISLRLASGHQIVACVTVTGVVRYCTRCHLSTNTLDLKVPCTTRCATCTKGEEKQCVAFCDIRHSLSTYGSIVVRNTGHLLPLAETSLDDCMQSGDICTPVQLCSKNALNHVSLFLRNRDNATYGCSRTDEQQHPNTVDVPAAASLIGCTLRCVTVATQDTQVSVFFTTVPDVCTTTGCPSLQNTAVVAIHNVNANDKCVVSHSPSVYMAVYCQQQLCAKWNLNAGTLDPESGHQWTQVEEGSLLTSWTNYPIGVTVTVANSDTCDQAAFEREWNAQDANNGVIAKTLQKDFVHGRSNAVSVTAVSHPSAAIAETVAPTVVSAEL